MPIPDWSSILVFLTPCTDIQFLVTKLIRFCPAYRAIILRELQGNVLRLLLHREASSVLADAFELYTNAYERSILLRDFYGKEASLFTVTAGSDEEKERSKRGLRGLMEGLEGDRRKRILGSLKDNLVTVFVLQALYLMPRC